MQELLFLGRPVTAHVDGTRYTGYLKTQDYMWNKIDGHTDMSTVSSYSIDRQHNTPGAGFVMSKPRPQQIQASKPVCSGNRHLVPSIPAVAYRYTYVNKLAVHIRSFVGYVTIINVFP